MRRFRVRVSSLICLAMLFAACGSPPTPLPPVRFETRIFEKALPGCEEDGKPDCASVRLEYPEFTAAPSEAARQKLNDAVQAAILTPFDEGVPKASSPEHLARLFFGAFKKGIGASWFLRRTLTVELAGPKSVIVTGLEELHTGRGEPRETRTRLDLAPN